MFGGKNRGLVPKKASVGYTIVEVMIVLAISGVMFVIAATFINGRQARVAFTQGVNEMASRLQAVINEVGDGQYSDIPVGCSASGSGIILNGSNPQGTNNGCTFIGKFVYFCSTSNGGDIDHYEVLPLAGVQGVQDIQSIGQTPLFKGSGTADSQGCGRAGGAPANIDLIRDFTIPQGLTVDKSVDGVIVDSTKIKDYGFGFMQSLGSLNANGNYVSGPQTVNLIQTAVVLGDFSQNKPKITSTITNTKIGTATSAVVCLTDGSRWATITMGTSNNALNVDVKMGLSSC